MNTKQCSVTSDLRTEITDYHLYCLHQQLPSVTDDHLMAPVSGKPG